MGRFNVSSHNLARQQLLQQQQQQLASLQGVEQSLTSLEPINPQQSYKSSDPVLGFEEKKEIDPIEDFLEVQYEAKRRGLDVSILKDTPLAEQLKQQLGRSNPGFLIKGKGADKIATRNELDEHISNTPLVFHQKKGEEEEVESGVVGRIARAAKSFFIGDTKKEMILNIGLMAIPATLPLKGLQLGLKAGLRLAARKSPEILEGTKEVKLLVDFIKKANKISPEVQIERTKVTKQRVSRAKKAMVRFDERDRPLARLKRSRVVQRGPLPSERMKKPLISIGRAAEREALIAKGIKSGKPISEVMEETDKLIPEGITYLQRDKLMNMVLDSNQDIFTRQTAGFGIYNLINFGALPTRSTLRAMEKTFGAELGKEIRKAIPKWKRFEEGLVDVLSLPKSIVSSFDVSAPFRQGFFLINHTDKFFSAGKSMFQALGSQKAADKIALEIAERPTARMSKQAGLFLSDSLNNAEEAFMSKFANSIPGVRRSARAYTTFLNKLRADVFDQMYVHFGKNNHKVTRQEVEGLARWINRATGRGSLGPLEQWRGALNVGFFSPAYVMSRFQMPLSLIGESKAVRKMVIQDMLAAAGVTGTAMALMVAAGAKLNMDPRSSDFGKGRINNTRIDLGAGTLPIWKLAVQTFTGERKTLGLNKVQEIERMDILTRFIQSKFSPTMGVVHDIYQGETFLGGDFSAKHLATGEQIRQRLAPLFLQDLADAIEEQGWGGVPLGMPAAFGVGVATYHSVWDRRREAFEEMFPGEDFDKEYNRRGRSLLNVLNSHPGVIKELEALENKENINREEYRTEASNRFQALSEKREAEFRANVLAGRLQGKGLWDMAGKFNAERHATASAFWYGLEGDILAGAIVDNVAESLAQRYWGAELDEDPVTGEFDWEGREKKRSIILDDAKEANVPLEYVMGSGPTSHRGVRFKDPIVAEVMNRHEDDSVILREYWDIDKKIFKINPGSEKIRDKIQIAQANGESRMVIEGLMQHPMYKRYVKERNQAAAFMRLRDPELDARLYFWGFIDNLSTPKASIVLNRLSLDYLTNQE